jgi:hypothetical protein
LSGEYFSHSIDSDLNCWGGSWLMGGVWMSLGTAGCFGTAACPESRPQPVEAALNAINRVPVALSLT